MDKFIKINKKNELENTGECSLNEEESLLRDLLFERIMPKPWIWISTKITFYNMIRCRLNETDVNKNVMIFL